MSIYDYKVLNYQEKEVDLSVYKGKVLLIVNTAIKCGFAPQYDELEALYKKYHDQGFEILDFPCNQFFKQSPLLGEENHSACVLRFAIAFPQMYRIKVNGKEEHPLYRYLKDNAPENKGKNIKWNFTKFLVDREGTIVHRFEPAVKPNTFETDIAELLAN